MKKLLTPIVCLLFVACEKTYVSQPEKIYELSVDSVLTKDGLRSLPKDINGFYKLRLDTTRNQTLARVTGKILVNGKEPYPSEKIDWENNLYWLLRRGDTVAVITQAYVNYFTNQFVIINLPPMIASKDELVATINKSSYSGTGGEINTMIAPVNGMQGDTMVIQAHPYQIFQ